MEELCVQRFWLDVKQKRGPTDLARNTSERLEPAANMYTHKTGFSFNYFTVDWSWLALGVDLDNWCFSWFSTAAAADVPYCCHFIFLLMFFVDLFLAWCRHQSWDQEVGWWLVYHITTLSKLFSAHMSLCCQLYNLVLAKGWQFSASSSSSSYWCNGTMTHHIEQHKAKV